MELEHELIFSLLTQNTKAESRRSDSLTREPEKYLLCSQRSGYHSRILAARSAANIGRMTENELAKSLAKRLKTSNSQAADRIGRQLHEIVRQLRSGIPATLPGLGTLLPGEKAKRSPKPRKQA